MRKLYTTFKQVYGTKLRFKFWFSIPRSWKLNVKLTIGLVVYCSIYKAILVNNSRAKANAATKVLQRIQITSIFHTSHGSKHRTLKNQVIWN